jgi:hypothetical protein
VTSETSTTVFAGFGWLQNLTQQRAGKKKTCQNHQTSVGELMLVNLVGIIFFSLICAGPWTDVLLMLDLVTRAAGPMIHHGSRMNSNWQWKTAAGCFL